MLAGLNGWQRLWIVLTVLYLVLVVGFTAMVFPTHSEIARTRLIDSMTSVGEYRQDTEPGFQFEGAYFVRIKHYGDLSDEEIIKRLHSKWSGKVDFSKIEAEYKRRVEALPIDRAETVGIAFAVWLIPMLVVYALGIAVAWIIQGFKS